MNKAKILASGKFDVLHPGHLFYLREAKNLRGNSNLTVVVSNEKNVRNCVFSNEERKEILESIETVDEVIVGKEEVNVRRVLEEVRPDVVALGHDQDEGKIKRVAEEMNPSPKIERVEAYRPDKYSSSKIKERLD